MDITKEMEQVRSKITDTELLKDVGPVLADIERNFINLQDAKKSVDTESKGRKLEIRDDLKPEIETLKTENADLKKKLTKAEGNTDNATLKTERDDLLSFKNKVLAEKRTTFESRFKAVVKHDKFGKVKAEFKLPKYDGEEKDRDYKKIDFSEMSEEDMNANVKAMARLDRIEYFGEAEETIVDSDGKTVKKADDDSTKTKISKAKSIEELEEIQNEGDDEK